jgi:MFS family permease
VVVAPAAVTTACVLPSFLLGAMAVQVRRDLDFATSGIGLAFATFFLAASAASAVGGRIAERIGAVPAMRVAAVISAMASLTVAATAGSFVTLLVPLAVAGAANAVCQPAANLLIARAVPSHRQGVGFAVKQSAVPMATLLAGFAVPTLALTLGWRWAYVAAAVLALVTLPLVPSNAAAAATTDGATEHRGVPADGGGMAGAPGLAETGTGTATPDIHEAAEFEAGLAEDAGLVTGRRRKADVPVRLMALLTVGIGFGAAAAGTLGSFLVSAAVDAGISEGAAGLLLTGGSLAGITVRLAAGAQADRRDGDHLRVVALMLALGAGAFGLLATGQPWAYALAGPAGFCTAWAWPGLFNLAVVQANPSHPAAATGITQTGTYIGAVSGPLLFGVLADHTSYPAAWLVAAALALVAAAVMAAGGTRLRPGITRPANCRATCAREAHQRVGTEQ